MLRAPARIDGWQVLSEADKIEHKHLLTLEAAISENQTNEMKDKNLQLIVPRSLHETYSKGQQAWLMDLNTFFEPSTREGNSC